MKIIPLISLILYFITAYYLYNLDTSANVLATITFLILGGFALLAIFVFFNLEPSDMPHSYFPPSDKLTEEEIRKFRTMNNKPSEPEKPQIARGYNG